jgi:hypothetical protein
VPQVWDQRAESGQHTRLPKIVSRNDSRPPQRAAEVIFHLDRIETEINSVIAEPSDTDNVPWAEDVRELVVEMRASVEEKLDRVTEP